MWIFQKIFTFRNIIWSSFLNIVSTDIFPTFFYCIFLLYFLLYLFLNIVSTNIFPTFFYCILFYEFLRLIIFSIPHFIWARIFFNDVWSFETKLQKFSLYYYKSLITFIWNVEIVFSIFYKLFIKLIDVMIWIQLQKPY